MKFKLFWVLLIGFALVISACDNTPKNETGTFNSSRFGTATFK
jgi:hypothetical protein